MPKAAKKEEEAAIVDDLLIKNEEREELLSQEGTRESAAMGCLKKEKDEKSDYSKAPVTKKCK